MNAPLVMIVEDEASIRRFLRLAIAEENCRVAEAATLREGRLECARLQPDLVILDLGLPDGDGLELIREIRAGSHLPILILSARRDEADKIRALDSGADDYLTKPFGVGELRARLRALLRRSQQQGDTETPRLAFGTVVVDLARRQVLREGEVVHLTPLEFRLLNLLLAHPGKVLTQNRLLREIWGPAYAESSHYLRVYMGHLRQKLETDPTQPRHLLTETGVGYRFQP